MISCIICSRKKDISTELKENIEKTIGCDYEIIIIENSKNQYSIFSAYNEGIRRSNGDILCFMHEDLIFHTNRWGVNVLNTFKDNEIGIIGLIGSQFLPNLMASWWLCSAIKGVILQGEVNNDGKYFKALSGVKIDVPTDVVVVDGLWFCMTKDLCRSLNFDEQTYSSFHCYDIDICMQTLIYGKRVVVIPNVLVEHKSGGNVNKIYYEQLKKFHKKWKDNLPIWRGFSITINNALWVSEILSGYQRIECLNKQLKTSKSYCVGRKLLSPLKKIKYGLFVKK